MHAIPLLIAFLLAQASQPALPWREPPDAPGPPRNLPDIAAEVVVELASSPTAPELGSPEGWSHSHFLDLAADWPDPHFRRPLIRLARHSNPAIAAVAGVALTRYADEESIATVAHMRGDFRSAGSAPVAEIIRRAEEARNVDAPVEVDLPAALRAFRVDPGMSRLDVARAAELLERDNDRDALLGFAWLASRGIVLGTDPLTRQWDRLNEPTRAELLRSFRYRTYVAGHRDLRDLLWQFLERRADAGLTEKTVGELVDTLLYLGHSKVYELLRQSLDARTSVPVDADMLRAIAQRLEYWPIVQEHVDRRRAWLRSMNFNLHNEAVRELRQFPPSDAQQQFVTDFFWTRVHSEHAHIPDSLQFGSDGLGTQTDRSHYPRMLEQSLALSVRRSDEWKPRIHAAACIMRLEMLTGEILGPSITREWGGHQEFWITVMCEGDGTRLRRVAAAWSHWVQDHAVEKPQESADVP